ncbi:sodium channel modifier 1 [Pipra filicauda]|uniref:Sodium channel modifier 1 n=1 Tax=Pipra filicauda TaxID=649802 RepID=A0A6J2FYK9_9PASS|nr:sodium channel modifier 1 [Pipra filicauda]
MSFKRDGDDPGPLGALQKRRVSDLLANSIPEDEAVLLRSGRFACAVCPHRPVCDTLEALAVHRAGRRHLHSLQRSYGRNRSLPAPAPAPEAPGEAPGVQGSQAPLLARTRRIARSALLKSAPYSSCCRRKGAQGSSSRAGTTRTVPEPLRNVGESQDVGESRGSPALLLEHGSGRADVPKAPTRKGKSCSVWDELSPERRRVLQHHLHLRSSGWIQDPCGKWVKDGNAEFDSDEDEPPALPPT